jgi:hypothetical protein
MKKILIILILTLFPTLAFAGYTNTGSWNAPSGMTTNNRFLLRTDDGKMIFTAQIS